MFMQTATGNGKGKETGLGGIQRLNRVLGQFRKVSNSNMSWYHGNDLVLTLAVIPSITGAAENFLLLEADVREVCGD